MLRKINVILITLFLCSNLVGYAVGNSILIIYILFTIYVIFQNHKINFPNYFYPFLIFVIFCGLSYFWSENTHAFWVAFRRKLYLLLPFFVFQHPKFNKEELQKIIMFFGFFLVAFLIFSISTKIPELAENQDYSQITYHSLVDYYENNAIYISLYVAVTIISFYILDLYQKYYYLLIGLFVFLILLSSKNIIATTLLLTIIYFVPKLMRQNKVQSAYFLVVFSVVIATAAFLLKDKISDEIQSQFTEILSKTDFQNYYWTGTDIRLFLLKVAYLILHENHCWLLGVGLGNAHPYIESIFKEYNLYYDFFDYNFHNQYAQFLVELGLVGLSLFIIFLVYNFRYLHHYVSARTDYIISLLCIAFLTESYLERQHGILFFALILAVYLNSLPNSSKEKSEIKA